MFLHLTWYCSAFCCSTCNGSLNEWYAQPSRTQSRSLGGKFLWGLSSNSIESGSTCSSVEFLSSVCWFLSRSVNLKFIMWLNLRTNQHRVSLRTTFLTFELSVDERHRQFSWSHAMFVQPSTNFVELLKLLSSELNRHSPFCLKKCSKPSPGDLLRLIPKNIPYLFAQSLKQEKYG